MKSVQSPLMKVSAKAPTGITGFDDITNGGLPHGRTTMVVGGSGSGKTVFALQFLVHGAHECKEPGIFVAFEENSKRIVANAESFGWKLAELQRKKLFFMDVHPMPDMVQAGDFDISGMLAALEARFNETKARRIVFDALDIVLTLLPDEAARRREIYRLHEWLLVRELTGIITLKADAEGIISMSQRAFNFMHFVADCTVILSHSAILGISQRNIRVQKYRGSSFDEDELPFVIGKNGFEVAVAHTPSNVDDQVTNERISSGVDRLDTMLGGGYYRGASVLITGFAGTAKTTLSGAFANAACLRGERTLFVSFDSEASEVVRNLSSVGILLDRYVKSGSLRVISTRTITGSAETFLARIKTLAKEHKARCLVIDPVSTWSKASNTVTARSVAERLIHWCKANGTTLVCTSLLDEMSSHAEGHSSLQMWKIADTWIHLNYLLQGGERNRSLSIIKSRGTAHSNQVRELILSDSGVTLTDTYTAGGEVLMGALRWQKERADRVANEVNEVAANLKRVKLDAEEAELEVRLKSLQTELLAKQAEKKLLILATDSRKAEISQDLTHLEELRGIDTIKTGGK